VVRRRRRESGAAPRQRLRDIGDARLELERALAGHDSTASDLPTRPRTTWVRVSLTAGVALLLFGLGWMLALCWALPAPRAPRTASLLIPSRTSTYFRASDPVLSPDGRFVAFSARQNGATGANLWARALDSFEAKPLAETSGAQSPF
jgi:hypothetical protein